MNSLLALLFSIIIILAGLLIVVRLIVGRKIFEEAMGHWLYDILKTTLRFPFRLFYYLFTRIWWFVRMKYRKL